MKNDSTLKIQKDSIRKIQKDSTIMIQKYSTQSKTAFLIHFMLLIVFNPLKT